MLKQRDITIFVFALVLLAASTIPPFQKEPQEFYLFGVRHADIWYFIYDNVNKATALLAISIARLKEKTVWLRIIIYPLFTDFLYEFIDLWITDDKGGVAGLIIQNTTIAIGFFWGASQRI